MEPVPEMEELRSSPIPRVRLDRAQLFNESDDYFSSTTTTTTESRKPPPTLRRSTDPIQPSPRSPGWNFPTTTTTPLPYRSSRNSSPYSRGHSRSRSTASALAPPMSRAQSLPGVNTAGHVVVSSHVRPESPLGSPARFRALRRPSDEIFPGFPARELGDIGETEAVQENGTHTIGSPNNMNLTPGSTHPKTYRPPSPLRHLSAQYATCTGASSQSSAVSSPKYNESFPSSYSSYQGSSSSIPSTPTSMRSRSPSISSLETIEDSPDAEEAALEAYNIAQLKAAADAADAADGDEAQDARRKASLDGGRGRTLGLGARDKRKRWSVCGAERRGDLDLETIWED